MQIPGDTPADTLLDALGDGMLIVDAHDIVLYANAAAGRVLGSPAEALVRQPCAVPVPVPAHGSTAHVLPSGATLTLETKPITWHGTAASLVIMRPVAGRQGAQGRAQRSDHIYRLLAQNIPDGDIYLFGRDLRILLAAGRNMTRRGLAAADFEGKSLEESLGRQTARILEPLYTKAIAGEDSEIELALADEHYRIRTLPIRDEQGRVVLGMSLFQDITRLERMKREAHRLNEQLQDLLAREQGARAEAESQRALLKGVLDQASAMMCILRGPEHVYEYVNDVYCEALERTPAELMGRNIVDVFPDLADIGIHSILDEVYRTGQPFSASELSIPVDLHRDGRLQEMCFTLSAQPMRNADGQVTGIVVHAVDVTDQVVARQAVAQHSAEVARLNHELERRIRELAVANRELEAFAYSVSHDLRAPLRRIDGFSQALLEDYADRLDEDGAHYLTRIRASAEHMGELIDDLLALSRVSRQELQTGAVHLSTMAHAIVAELREQAPGRQVTVRIAPDVRAWGDARMLRIALENLLENAWKFTGKKPGATIEVGALEQAGERVYFVRDDGAGFDPAYTEKLFGTFNRLHSPAEFPGVGIGLATVKRVLDRHGGRIWAEGAVGRGAAFYFTLPGGG